MLTLEDFTSVSTQAADLLGTVRSDDLTLPTPCDGWNVGELIKHIVDNAVFFASAAGAPAAEVTALEAAEASSAYESAAGALFAAYSAPGLAPELPTPFGVFPASVVFAVSMADQLTHCWDLAHALGRSIDIDPRLADRAIATWDAFMAAVPPDAGLFAPAVDAGPGATNLGRVAARAGRHPENIG